MNPELTTNKRIFPSALGIYTLLGASAFVVLLVIAAWFFSGEATAIRVNFFASVLAIAITLVFALDAYGAWTQPRITLHRKVASSLAVNRWSKVTLTLQHQFMRHYQLHVFEHLPATHHIDSEQLWIDLVPGKTSHIEYQVKSTRRGPWQIAGADVRLLSPLRFWQSQYFVPVVSDLKVYPDFSVVTSYALLATDNHVSQLGIKRKPRRGQGLDFLQLRDYRQGDSLRQIDWKGSARRNQLISKEYQDERDQQVVILLDCGRRMRAQDDDLNHFDHALNASLLLSYIALRQGDSVGFLTFAGSKRWLSPQKGQGKVKSLLAGLYDLHTTTAAPDYVAAAEQLSALQSKRSLVVLVTNSRDEDVGELQLAINVLKKRHLVLLANIREQVIDDIQQKTIASFDDALLYAGASHYLVSRRESHKRLLTKGTFAFDCLAKELATKVTNRYLEIKRSGVL